MANVVINISDLAYEFIKRFVGWGKGNALENAIAKGTLLHKDLILCKDCKWFNTYGCAIDIVYDTDKPEEDDYCSFAERENTDGDNVK